MLSRLPLKCHVNHINKLRPRKNGRHFADDLFKCIFLDENVRNSIEISLKFLPNGPNNNIPALVQVMVWRRPRDKPLSRFLSLARSSSSSHIEPVWRIYMRLWTGSSLLLHDWSPMRNQWRWYRLIAWALFKKTLNLNQNTKLPIQWDACKNVISKMSAILPRLQCDNTPWWRHRIEAFSALLALCAGNSPVTGEFPTQRPVTRSFDGFFDLRLE